jgi:N-carbamoylputrescine amidase
LTATDAAWSDLVARVERVRPDLLVLNEMPWGPWLAATLPVDDEAFDAACALSETAIGSLPASIVLGSRPARRDGHRVNEAFIWNRGYRAVHTKQYFPEEPGFHEASWFERGSAGYQAHEVEGLRVGFLLCTEVMFNEKARHLGRAGVQILAVPRGTEAGTIWRWQVAMQMAAIASGAWVLSSNRCDPPFGGAGFIVSPSGRVLAETSPEVPLQVMAIDPKEADRQQKNYPCYVPG